MSQKKVWSLIEAIAGTLVKFSLSLPIQMFIVFPLFGVEVGVATNIGVWISMSVASLVITYVVRRVFNLFT